MLLPNVHVVIWVVANATAYVKLPSYSTILVDGGEWMRLLACTSLRTQSGMRLKRRRIPWIHPQSVNRETEVRQLIHLVMVPDTGLASRAGCGRQSSC